MKSPSSAVICAKCLYLERIKPSATLKIKWFYSDLCFLSRAGFFTCFFLSFDSICASSNETIASSYLGYYRKWKISLKIIPLQHKITFSRGTWNICSALSVENPKWNHIYSLFLVRLVVFGAHRKCTNVQRFDPNPMVITYLFELVASHEFQWFRFLCQICVMCCLAATAVRFLDEIILAHVCWLWQKKILRQNSGIKSVSTKFISLARRMKWCNRVSIHWARTAYIAEH